MGYKENKSMVISNGTDSDWYRPNRKKRAVFRHTQNIPSEAFVVAHVGRFDPTKDHRTFLNAAGLVNEKMPNSWFIMCGKGIDFDNSMISMWISEEGIKNKVSLFGMLEDMRGFYAAADLFVLSSVSEAFPLAIGEAMSCGVPCVVTDVGDCAFLVGDTGIVVPPGDPIAMAEAIGQFVANSDRRKKMGEKARQRIIDHFEITKMVNEYEDLLLEVNRINVEASDYS
jgi:glycosyltransferase involved in cell wall biosynthesis